MLAYYGTKLSPHMDKTPEGYLICRDVPIARTGRQDYLARELGLDGDPERVVPVNRHPEDVFDPAALASFEGKDVTSGHPPEHVGPENHSNYSCGHVENVRHSGDYMVADLFIKDANLVNDVWNGTLREVSCGYLCEYVPDGDGYRQQRIRGNHVAVVPRGRAGHEVAIKDQSAVEAEQNQSAAPAEKGRKSMSDFWKSVLTAFGMAAKDASPEELDAMVATAGAALDAAPAPEKKEDAPEKKEDAPPADDAQPAADVMVERAPKGDDLGSKLDKVIEMLASLQHKNDREEKKLSDEKTIDALVERLSGDPAAVIPAGDSSAGLLRAMRPAVAAIKDEKERARVVDALVAAVRGPDVMGDVMQAAADNARKAADAAQANTFEARCREAEAAYAARNPHKKKEEN